MSIAIAVFPVCLSPIISSRWPLPIGVIASIALIPVSKGEFTLSLVITPGATTSIGLLLVYSIGPRPSIGWPNASTTRPNIFSPTGTSITEPVLLTMSPSLIKVSSPKRTAPTWSISRFITKPYTSCGKTKSSPSIAFSRP